eukprot:s616_g10.t1
MIRRSCVRQADLHALLRDPDLDTWRLQKGCLVLHAPVEFERTAWDELDEHGIKSQQSKDTGACVLDVDPPTARNILSYDWARALKAAYPSKQVELRLVTVWVTMKTLDDILDRNQRRLEAQGLLDSVVRKQLGPLRAQVTSDLEWALTSGKIDFTVINEDVDVSMKEIVKASEYCFEDPF